MYENKLGNNQKYYLELCAIMSFNSDILNSLDYFLGSEYVCLDLMNDTFKFKYC